MITSDEAAELAANHHEWAKTVAAIVNHLPDTERAVVTLGYFHRLTQQQIAQQLDLSRQAVAHAMASALSAICHAQES